MCPLRLAGLASLVCLAAGCGPSIDRAAKADLDKHLAAVTTSQETYPPSESFLPMAFHVGQWTQHRVVDAKGNTSLLTYKLVGQEDGGYWLEMVTETPQGREAVKLHVALLGGRDPAGMEIRAIRIKKNNELPVNVDAADLPTVRPRYRGALDLLTVWFEGNLKDDAHVPAGRFIGCYTNRTSAPWGPWQQPTLLCSHPSVPLSGVVRAQTTSKTGLMELVAFGVTGAESEF
jgi:hypothetical protein